MLIPVDLLWCLHLVADRPGMGIRAAVLDFVVIAEFSNFDNEGSNYCKILLCNWKGIYHFNDCSFIPLSPGLAFG